MNDRPGKSHSLAKVALVVLAALVLYLGFAPVPIDPVAWTPPLSAGFTGDFSPAFDLTRLESVRTELVGPEAIAFDEQGRVVTGLLDGRIVRLGADDVPTTLVDTGGRPLGLVYAPDGTLYVADSPRGLLALSPSGELRVLVDAFEGRHLLFVDDLDLLPDGRIVFTDASDRFPVREWKLDLIEHRPRGRVFVHDPRDGSTKLLADGLYFANGLAAAADGTFVLVCETGGYRVQRIELAGPAAGRRWPVLQNLPGFCDNIHRSEDGASFFVSIPSPRDPILDATSGHPWLRRVIVRLPDAVQPAPKVVTSFVRIDGRGAILATAFGEGVYGPTTTTIDHGGVLWFGSLSAPGLGRLPLR